jgi:hypothetical protein
VEYLSPRNAVCGYFIEVSLIPGSPKVLSSLAGLHRHDRVRIKGQLLDNPSPQTHVELSSLEVVKRYESTPAMPAYTYSADIPADLRGEDSALFLVHNVGAGGRILVVEYEDVVLPSMSAARSSPEIWHEHGNVVASGRNKLISTNVRVRATGKFNEIDPNQANVQIVLDGYSDSYRRCSGRSALVDSPSRHWRSDQR